MGKQTKKVLRPHSARHVELKRNEHWCVENYKWVLRLGPNSKPVSDKRALEVAEARLDQYQDDAVELRNFLRNLILDPTD